MSHIMKYTEWQTTSGRWCTGDTSDLTHGSNHWWHIPRMLNMTLTDYILFLIKEYKIYNLKFFQDSGLLLWDFPSYNECHKFTLFVNREAKKRQYYVGLNSYKDSQHNG